MRRTSLLPFLLIAWPVAEIAVLIWVGGRLGIVNTIGLLLLGAFGGLALFRHVGFGLMRRVQAEMAGGRMPAGALLEGLTVLIAGFLLILPGFLSDLLAFLLLFAPARRLLIAAIAARVTVSTMGAAAPPRRDGVVDLDEDEWQRRGDDRPPASGPSIPPPRDGADRP